MNERKYGLTAGQFPPTVKLEAEGECVEGDFLRVGEGATKGGKKFPILFLRKLNGMEVSIPMPGHLEFLVKQSKLVEGDGVRVTFVGWDTMEESGNKVRRFALEKAL